MTRAPDDLQGLKLLAALRIQKQRRMPRSRPWPLPRRGGRADQQTYDLLAQAYTEAGRQDEAVQSLERAAALAPDNAGMRTRLAAARMGAGKTDAAIADLEASLAMAPAQPAIGAGPVLRRAVDRRPRSRPAALGRVRAAQGDTTVVRNLDGLLKMAQLDPDASPGDLRGHPQGRSRLHAGQDEPGPGRHHAGTAGRRAEADIRNPRQGPAGRAGVLAQSGVAAAAGQGGGRDGGAGARAHRPLLPIRVRRSRSPSCIRGAETASARSICSRPRRATPPTSPCR